LAAANPRHFRLAAPAPERHMQSNASAASRQRGLAVDLNNPHLLDNMAGAVV
jgi:hypothetical protein